MIVYVKTSSPKSRRQRAKTAAIRSKQRQIRGKDSFVVLERRIIEVLRPGALDFQQAGSATGRITSCETAFKEVPRYTGSSMIGVSTMHKSNLVPVFSAEEAQDLAKMRR